MSLDSLTYSVERLQKLRDRDRFIDALYKSFGILGLGSSIYLGWWIYHFSTDMSISVRNALGEALPVDFPPVNPYLKTAEARKAYIECLAKEGKL